MKRNITYRICILLACVIVTLHATAQEASALDYFNRASREYVKQDKLTALRTLDQGLGRYPGDPRLLKLAEELLKEEEQQQQQEQQDQQQDQDQQDEQEQEGDKGDGEQDEQKDEGKEERNDESKPGDQDRNEREQQQPRQQPGTIAPEDARRMLDALDRQEKEVQDKVRAKQRPAVRTPIEKDW